MTLQQRVEDGGAAYIHSLLHDADSRILRIHFMRADTWVVYGTLTFEGVESYRFEFDTDEDKKEFEEGLLIEGLLGLAEITTAAYLNYYLKTDVREITFSTSVQPTWLPTMPHTDLVA